LSDPQLVSIGKTEVRVPLLGIGAWSWGDRWYWGFGRGYAEADVRGAYDASLKAGIHFFDTAEAYGSGYSEQLLGRFIRESKQPVIVATKFMPLPWRLRRGSLVQALRRSLDRLGLKQADLYQIHWPFPPAPIEQWVNALADAVEAGLTRAVGVSNYNLGQMRRAHEVLARRGIPLASNQVEYSLLHRQPERDGVLNACRELNVTLIAYSPIAKGLLSGKYTPDNPPPGLRGRYGNRERLSRLQPLIDLLRQIGAAHGGKTPAQVALNWTICKGALPIPGAKNAAQVGQNAGALGWRLTDDEVVTLDAAGNRLTQ
jgi:aryl-alcohol dehydrogenase-like predicted oxidoreductase